jgi:UDP-2-acetamido-3-amino-2,3-dideoxy-glucuronate N-acetyltransferase
MKTLPAVGVAGCGYWGKNLIRNFSDLGSLRAVCDVDSARANSLAAKYKVDSCTSFTELLARSDIQAVVIAAPAAEHFALAKKALLADKDVFVEKPLALSVEEGEQLADLSVTTGRILMVGHLLHYHPAVRKLKELIREGALGKIEYIYSSRLNFGKLRTEENILWSFAPHDISAILHLLDEEPTSVAANGGAYLSSTITDVTLTSCTFASGVTAHIFVSWLHPFKEQKLVIVGDRQMAVFDDTEPVRKLVLYPHQVEWVERHPVAKRSEGRVVELPSDEPLKMECQHFLDCVASRSKPETDGWNGVRVLRVLNAAQRSLIHKGEVQDATTKPADKPKYYVDPSAIVDQPCVVGEGTHIWHFSHVMKNSAIGKNCNFGQNVHIASGVKIGNNVKIQNNVSLYTGVELEDDVFCGPSMVFTNVINPRSHVNRKNEYQRTLIRRGASLGANSTIVCGTTIGEYAFVGAGAVVTKDIPGHALVVGCPAHQIGWMCQCGVRLTIQDGKAKCESCGLRYEMAGETLRNTSSVDSSTAAQSPVSQLMPSQTQVDASAAPTAAGD